MATFSYDHDENRVYAISQNDEGRSSVRLTVDELAAFLETQNFTCSNSLVESVRIMLTQGQKGQILDPLVVKALDWKKRM